MRQSRVGLSFRFGIVALGSMLIATLAATVPAQAANPQVVTSKLDDGTAGTLRSALGAVDVGGTITFDSTVFPANTLTTITLTTGELTIAKNLTIQGLGRVAVNGPDFSVCSICFRVFLVNSGVSATIDGLTISAGAEFPSGDGGGILNNGNLAVTNRTISGNTVSGNGGGILNNGNLTVTNSTLSNNTSYSDGGAIYSSSTGTLTVTASTISGNTTPQGEGAGIYKGFAPGSMDVTNSIVSGNTASLGGGISQDGGFTTVTNSTISNNNAGGAAGLQNTGGGTMTVNKSTISGNNTDGIFNGLSSTLSVTNSTIAGNSGNCCGGIDNGAGHTVTVTNSIIASNTPANCVGDPVTDGGYNISFGGTGCPGTFSSGDPKLGSLADNGGTTALPDGSYVNTMALGSGSVAINAGNDTVCNAAPPPPVTNTGAGGVDQRGFKRTVGTGPHCDIGAFEVRVPGAPTGPTATAGDTKVTLNWTASASPDLAATYSVFKGLSPGGEDYNTSVNSTPITGTTYTVEGLANSTTYYFTLQARNDAGKSDVSDEVSATPQSPVLPANFSITNTDSPDPVTSGQTLTYTIVVTNTGDLTANSVSVSDTLPTTVVFKSASSSQGSCTRSTSNKPPSKNGTVTCTVGSLTGGSSVTITIIVTPTKKGALTNTATVTGTGVTQKSATATTTVTGA